MALNWDLTKIINNDQLCWLPTGKKNKDGEDEYALNPVTDALIWLTMFVDLAPREEKDAQEFFIRVRQWEKANGPILMQREEYWAVADLNANTFQIFNDEKKAAGEATSMGAHARLLKGERSVGRPITWEDVFLHIGLSTNVSTESKAKFKNKVMKALRDEAERSLGREEREWAEKQKTNIDRMKEAVEDGMA